MFGIGRLHKLIAYDSIAVSTVVHAGFLIKVIKHPNVKVTLVDIQIKSYTSYNSETVVLTTTTLSM